MIIDWLYRTALETSLLIALVLVLRPIVKRTLGAKVTYGLWVLPLIRVFLPDRPERDTGLLEAVGIPTGNLQTEFVPIPDFVDVSGAVPWGSIWVAGLSLWLLFRTIVWHRFQKALHEQAQSWALPSTLGDPLFNHFNLPVNKVAFFTCSNPGAPFVSGLLQPAVYLPTDFATRFSTQEQLWILVHELTHVKRKDLWVQALCEIVRAVFWFNPVVHFATQVVQEDQELACDSSILSRCTREERRQYGKALLAGMGPRLMPSALAFFSKSQERFTMLSKHKVSKLNTAIGVCLCAVISMFALTKAPSSIAQRPAFDEVYDADAPVLIQGTIINIDQFADYSHVYVEAEQENGAASVWIVEGAGEKAMEDAGITNAVIGRKAVIRGYQSLDKSCDPYCMMNGRDIKFIDD